MKSIDLGATEKSSRDTSFFHTEYNALRAEILKRLDIENQLMTFTVIVFSTIVGVGYQNKSTFLILLYPVISAFFSIGWTHSDYMTRLMGRYIKDRIESEVGVSNLGWEHYLSLNFSPSNSWTARGIFIATELIAIMVGLSLAPLNTTFIVLLFRQPMINPNSIVNFILCIAVTSLICTLFIFRQRTIKTSQMPITLIHLGANKTHK